MRIKIDAMMLLILQLKQSSKYILIYIEIIMMYIKIH